MVYFQVKINYLDLLTLELEIELTITAWQRVYTARYTDGWPACLRAFTQPESQLSGSSGAFSVPIQAELCNPLLIRFSLITTNYLTMFSALHPIFTYHSFLFSNVFMSIILLSLIINNYLTMFRALHLIITYHD